MTFPVAHHDSLARAVSAQLIDSASQRLGYHLLTTPVTNAHFRQRAFDQLASHLLDHHEPSSSSSASSPGQAPFQTSHSTRPLVVAPLSSRDSHLSPTLDVSRLICITSPWIDLCSPDPLTADFSRQVLKLEVSYAAFCGIPYLVIPGPELHHRSRHEHEGLIYYARAISEAIGSAPFMHIAIAFDLVDDPRVEPPFDEGVRLQAHEFAREEYVLKGGRGPPLRRDDFGTWEAWDVIRSICKHSARLGVALSLPRILPPVAVQSRWASEPVRFITMPSSTFVENAKGYPVLSQHHQQFISRLMCLRPAPWVILSGVDPISANPETSTSTTTRKANSKHHQPQHQHLSYIRHLERSQPRPRPIDDFGDGFQDYLQVPLQPLADNLESVTYEGFERDPIKYAWYERAITAALRDWVGGDGQGPKPMSSGDGQVVVAVAGAGRGPLVTRTLRASEMTGVPVEIWVIEKNINAYVLLQRQNELNWGGHVRLVQSDMRSWKGPCRAGDGVNGGDTAGTHYPVDILISELLGSFGDNELSPECLDGVTHLLAPEHGISIPSSYSAHLTPISTPRLHADIRTMAASNPAAFETPYVVLLHAFDNLSTTTTKGSSATAPIVKTAWSFSHPNPNISAADDSSALIPNAHNVRRTTLSFPCATRSTCHGFAGYFEAVLYKDIQLSTNPVTMDAKSKDMLSWFPIFFPLRTPLTVPGDDKGSNSSSEIVVTMYRQTDGRKVWYEWVAEVFVVEEQVEDAQQGQQVQGQGQGQGQRKDAERSFASVAAASRANTRTPSQPSQTSSSSSAPKRKRRIAMTELHSSIKEGCLM